MSEQQYLGKVLWKENITADDITAAINLAECDTIDVPPDRELDRLVRKKHPTTRSAKIVRKFEQHTRKRKQSVLKSSRKAGKSVKKAKK